MLWNKETKETKTNINNFETSCLIGWFLLKWYIIPPGLFIAKASLLKNSSDTIQLTAGDGQKVSYFSQGY